MLNINKTIQQVGSFYYLLFDGVVTIIVRALWDKWREENREREKKIRKRKLGVPRLKLNGLQEIKRDQNNNNNNPRHTTVSNSVELSIRFLAPCFYANICEILEGLGLRRDKRTMSKDNGDNWENLQGRKLVSFLEQLLWGENIHIYIYIHSIHVQYIILAGHLHCSPFIQT